MNQRFYQLEIVADPSATGEIITKTDVIKKDLLMTSRRIALFKFEEHFKALQTGELQKNFEEEGYTFTGDTTISLSIFLILKDKEAKKGKKVLLQRVESIPSENLDFDMEILQAEQDAVSELMKEGRLPHERPVLETHLYRLKVWYLNGPQKESISIIDYPFHQYLDAYFDAGYKFKDKSSKPFKSELFIVETHGQQEKEYLLIKDGKKIFQLGFLIERDAHWKFSFENGLTGWFGNRRLPEIYPGKFDKNIYWWIETE